MDSHYILVSADDCKYCPRMERYFAETERILNLKNTVKITVPKVHTDLKGTRLDHITHYPYLARYSAEEWNSGDLKGKGNVFNFNGGKMTSDFRTSTHGLVQWVTKNETMSKL